MIPRSIMNQMLKDIQRITGASMRLCTQDELLPGDCIHYDQLPDGNLLLETSGDNSVIAAQLFLCELSHIEQITKEKKSKATFLKDVILGKIQPDMTASSARKMHVTFHTPRAVFLVQVPPEDLDLGLKFASAIFSPSSGSQCFAVSDSRFVIVRELAGTDSVSELAHQLADTLRAEIMTPVCVSTSSPADHLGELTQRFQEAVTALTISSVFTPDTYVSSYDRLGLGRLIYTLEPEVCRTFLQETFGAENPLNDLEPDTYELINQFFNHNLNITDTSKSLYLHRNTLIYRLEKIREQTGFDIRRFDDAMTFRIAMLVNMRLARQ
ncbi:MAG: helix-turn-helix domain-containing protein [Eubacterium sp.]|nr:helix-turn-helix domain-containing protein [Eubacterium sp.]